MAALPLCIFRWGWVLLSAGRRGRRQRLQHVSVVIERTKLCLKLLAFHGHGVTWDFHAILAVDPLSHYNRLSEVAATTVKLGAVRRDVRTVLGPFLGHVSCQLEPCVEVCAIIVGLIEQALYVDTSVIPEGDKFLPV